MNIFTALFGIFRQRGLVTVLREGGRLGGFALSAIVASVIGGALYGVAMGIGLGPETAMKDGIKLALIVLLGLLFAMPIFWLAFRLLGREERFSQISAVPLTFISTTAIVLAVTAPIVFMLSLLAGFSPEAVYIHIVIVDLALLVGLYLAGTLIYYGLTGDRSRLVVPNVISFVMLGVILVVLMLFFSPFLSLSPTFSTGVDLFGDRLGIGVADKGTRALAAASTAERQSYRFQTTNANGDLERDYIVTRVGDDYLVEVKRHTVPNETPQTDKHIWILNGVISTDFTGRVTTSDRAALDSYLKPALPPGVFHLPEDFSAATWRGYGGTGSYSAVGTTANQAQASVTLDAATLRLTGLVIGRADKRLAAETRVLEVKPGTMDRAALQMDLNQATVLGSVDRSDASLQDYVQSEAFFVVRIPRNWRAGSWNTPQKKIDFANDCGMAEGCPALTVTVYDLDKNRSLKDYADNLAASLGRQPEYREVKTSTGTAGNNNLSTVEYLYDRTVKGQIETTHHIEYIFAGSTYRYHLDFSAPASQFEANRALFAAVAQSFVYLKPI